ncbi:MAG: DUF1404 family protein [Nitrososphaerales archaeon]
MVAIEPGTSIQRSKTMAAHTRFILIGLIGTIVLLFEPVDTFLDSNLTLHMFQHIGIFVFNIIFGYGLERYVITKLPQLRRRTYVGWKAFTSVMVFNTRTKGLILAGVVPAFIFAYWHIPANFDYAATTFYPHVLEHFSYIIAGNLVGLSIKAIPKKWKIILVYIGFMQAGMMGSMMLVWPYFYTAYPMAQNLQMDAAIMMFGAIGILATSSTLLKQLDIV